ncbi:peptidoglycan-binding protein [Candidatus Gracilibacteria bacterium]|nr:peptidoglycan-binding protein [Candidatus Gracilibacteria bacterium]
MAENNNIAQGSSLENILNDQQINERDLKEIENLKDTEKKLLKSITKEMLEKGYTIQNKKSFEVFQKMYQIAYGKTSGMFDWKKIEGSKIGQVTVLNEKNKNEDIKIRSVTVGRGGTIYIFSSNNSYSNRIIQNGKYYPNSKYSDNNSEFNDNEFKIAKIGSDNRPNYHNGIGKKFFQNGSYYIGEFKVGKPKGSGIFVNINKERFIGNFDTANGKTIITDGAHGGKTLEDLDKIATPAAAPATTPATTPAAAPAAAPATTPAAAPAAAPATTPAAAPATTPAAAPATTPAAAPAAAPATTPAAAPATTPAAAPATTPAAAPATQKETGTNSIKINQAWAKNQILTYKENFDYEKPTKQDIIDILAKYKDADFSKKENIPENSALVIYAIQLAIKELGYANDLGNIDGIFGQKTIEALKKLQEKKLGFTGEDIDGIPGPKTIQAMIEKLNAPA